MTIAAYTIIETQTPSFEGDGLMIAAILACGLGYAEGAILSRHIGGWQVISWALILASPLTSLIACVTQPSTWQLIQPSAWIALLYVAFFSMMLGFVFWYRGLSQGGIARIGQLQLLQPFGGLALSALLLGETVTPLMIGVGCIVLLCVLGAKNAA